MSSDWPVILPYEGWQATCDTLHAHTQVLGKLAVALAPAEPQLQHGALRLTARGWETLPLPTPDGSGALVVTLDLQRISIGGSVFWQHRELLLPKLRSHISGKLPSLTAGCDLVAAGLGERAGDFGALALVV